MLSDLIEEGQPQYEDSLFGSPPPSPLARGRSPSPTLALPRTPSTGFQALSPGSAHNVGTIALPGSHTNSEQSINPLAPTLSLPGGLCTPIFRQSLPPSQPQPRQGSSGINATPRPSPQPRHIPLSRTQSAISQRKSQMRKHTGKSNSKESTPRPQTLEIPLPDPSQPPPPHFLRNQQGLLGHAGLIAGVKPAKLTTLCGTPRGASPSNPIVLDDYEGDLLVEPPVIGRSHFDYFKNLDPSELPAPTNQEIIDMLIKQKDIFPVLQSIFKLLAAGASGDKNPAFASTPGTSSWYSKPEQRRAPSQPPIKRRKLNRVPAGAADWDVPYPFQEGEGPEAYRQNWVKERGRQLISQLIGLVKVAAKKAAAKKHLLEMEKKQKKAGKLGGDKSTEKETTWVDRPKDGRGANHYRGDSGSSDVVPSASPTHAVSIGPATSLPEITESSLPIDAASMHPDGQGKVSPSITPFDHLISSLLAATSNQPSKISLHLEDLPALPLLDSFQHSNAPAGAPTSFDPTLDPGSSVDQALVDSWMNVLQTFPLQLEGFSMEDIAFPALDRHPLLGTDTPSSGDLSSFASPLTGDSSSFSPTPNPDAQSSQTFNGLDFYQMMNLPPGSLVPAALGNTSLPASNALAPITIDLPTSYPYTQSNVQSHVPLAMAPMGAEQPIPSTSTAHSESVFVSHTLVPSLQTCATDHVIDQDLLALPPSKPHTLAASVLSRPTTINGQLPITDNSSSAFAVSPTSSFDPATPSSASWEMSMPEVVGEGFSQDQGLNGADLVEKLQKIQEEGGEQMEAIVVPSAPDNEIADLDMGFSAGTLTRSTASALTQLPAASSSGSDPAPASGIFQVLRATDWQPREPTRKLKKSEILKRAEEKRKELQAELEKVKVKLWEATIEHGALLHLVRLSGEAEESSSSSG